MSAASGVKNAMCLADDANSEETKLNCGVGLVGDVAGVHPHPIAQGSSVAIGLQQMGDSLRPEGRKSHDNVADAMVRAREAILETCGESGVCEALGQLGAMATLVGGSLLEGTANYALGIGGLLGLDSSGGGENKSSPPSSNQSIRTEMNREEINEHNRKNDLAGTGTTLYNPTTRSAIRK